MHHLGMQKAEAREQEREVAEERRLRYVATTRVRDHLVIPVVLPAEGHVKTDHWAVTEGVSLLRVALTHAMEEGGVESPRKEPKVFIYQSKNWHVPPPMLSLPVEPMLPQIPP